MNARELIDSLAGLPGVRLVTTSTEGIEGGALVNGIEVARAAGPAERSLRAAWRRRTSGGPTPLLLVADDPDTDGVVVALGPVTHDGPLRLVSADSLGDVLRRASALPALHQPGRLLAAGERVLRIAIVPSMISSPAPPSVSTRATNRGASCTRLRPVSTITSCPRRTSSRAPAGVSATPVPVGLDLLSRHRCASGRAGH